MNACVVFIRDRDHVILEEGEFCQSVCPVAFILFGNHILAFHANRKIGIANIRGISYEDIGRKAGELAYDILVNGKKAGDLPVTFAKDLEKKVVKSRADALKLTIPEGYKEISAEKAE